VCRSTFTPRGADQPHAEAIARAARAGTFNELLHPGLTNFLDLDLLPIEHLHAVADRNPRLAVERRHRR
jgi:hypothetical protein